MQRYLDAAFELIDEKGTTEFTIQEVIDRSQQSLRGFYQYFDGKDELLLALFEDSMLESAEDLREAVETEIRTDRATAGLHDPPPRVVRTRRRTAQAWRAQPAADLGVLGAARGRAPRAA